MGIGVLGPLEVDESATLSRRDRVVLAALAMRLGEPVSAERLADALWGDSPPPTWSKALQGCIVRLRRLLGREAISTSSQGYRLLVSADDVDAHRFERQVRQARDLLERGEADRAAYLVGEALALWRGRALADLEGWPEGSIEAGRLEEMRHDAEELAVESALASGRHLEVLADAQALVAAEPMREHRWELLALAQFHSGRQDDALRTLRQARRMLSVESGLDPGPELIRLEEAILRQDGSIAVPTPAELPSPACPYPGLLPYGIDDVDSFFGRADEIAACRARLQSVGVVTVVGPSGSGKSSLVRAGVAASLRRDGRRVVVITPGPHPMDVMPPASARAVVVVDQLEELALVCRDPAERDTFLTELIARSEKTGVVLAVRADRLAELCTRPALARMVEQSVYLLGPMTEEGLRSAVEGPARAAGLLLEPGLIDLLVREVQGESAALPLLSHALRMTWQRREGRTLTVSGYRETGGVRGAVAQSAEALFAELPPPQQAMVHDLLLRLLAPTPEGEPVRRRLARRALTFDDEHEEIVETLARARLVTTDEDTVEIAHEALTRAWPRLRVWLADDVVGHQLLAHLSVAAESWDALDRADSELYRGARLTQAREWRDRVDPDLTETETAFLDASAARAEQDLALERAQVAREARSARNTRRLAGALALALLLTTGATIVALRSQRDAAARAHEASVANNAADANRLAAVSDTVGALDLSLLLAAAAVRVEETPETADALLSALVDNGQAQSVTPLGGLPNDTALADDGRTLFISYAGNETSISAISLVGDQPGPPTPVSPLDGLVVDGSDHDDLVVSSYGPVNVSDSHGHKLLHLTTTLGGYATNTSFAPGGQRLTTVFARKGHLARYSIVSLDVDTGQVLDSYPVLQSPGCGLCMASSFSEDGSTAVVWIDAPLSAAFVDIKSGAVVPLRLRRESRDSPNLVALPDGVAQTMTNGDVIIYDRDGRPSQRLVAHSAEVNAVVVAPNGRWAATGADDDLVAVWDIDAATGQWGRRELLSGHTGDVVSLQLGHTANVLRSIALDGQMITWDVSPTAGFGRPYPTLGNRWMSDSPEFLDDGAVAVFPTRSGPGDVSSFDDVAVWATFMDTATGKVLAQVPVGRTLEFVFGSSVAVDPAGDRVAVTSGLATTVLDAHTHRVLAQIVLPAAKIVFGAGWNEDGSRLLIGAAGPEQNFNNLHPGKLFVIDPADWSVERRVALGGGGGVGEIETNHSGDLIAVADDEDNLVWILDSASLDILQTIRLSGHDNVFDLAFSPDDDRLAVGVNGGLAYVFDTHTWDPIHDPVHVNDGFVGQVEWMSDSNTVVAAGEDGTVALYDVDRDVLRGRKIPASTGGTAAGRAYVIPDPDTQLVTIAQDAPGRVYPMDIDSWLTQACAIAGRDLTPEEWARYLPGRPYEPTCDGGGSGT